ncbi:MsnO8 family LLM class oxidoreductase [Conexibacter sp. W3-3-2]|uniref:LLM class flavin-dependent oxidoreductase n=1 Tax=Paraconexibacter algicola TaxID=2133960 RepID=A0A2T4UG17_9ACTN|nr:MULTISPECIES: LLM class flavin-dependent oxidoreductase [Solirubrobacterales]MTD44428.1 MsnO8 family LLM class oxidoreductase [Conexibacter sp. W3-3-2]PTL58194.1 LLM class flavin-dependent oxidoreductase [Paraconexibacter algicola]
MRVSVLDQSPISQGSTNAQALANTLDLARTADRLGYHRYWVAEHHGGAMAGASPEALIGPIAVQTTGIRVGSGGVMLPHYSPLKVAETFSLLDGLAPGRIDLGIGRAPGTDGMRSFALQRDRRQAAPDDFPEHLAELLAHLGRRPYPPEHPFRHLQVRGEHVTPPTAGTGPVPWLLGSSPQSAIWAGQLGLPYAYADFISPDGHDVAQLYRDRFVPGEHLRAPQLLLASWALAAPDAAEALALVSSGRMMFKMLRRGRPMLVPPTDVAQRFLESEGDTAPPRRMVCGTPEQVRAALEERVQRYRADELMLVTITHDHAARVRSYRLLADAFGLDAREPAATAVAA